MPGSKSGSHAAKKRKIDAKPEEEKPNPFERRKTKLKHNVLGRNVKDTETNVGQLREKAVDIRKKTLLVEYNQRYKKNSFVDRRLGEGDETLTKQEQMAMRWLKERQRHSQGAGRFNLEGPEEVLTHRGSALGGAADYSADSDEDSEDLLLGEGAVAQLHFGGGDEDDPAEGEEGVRKSQKEIYAELIAKSKKAKAERRVAKEEQVTGVERLNAELAGIQALLAADMRPPEPRQPRTDEFDVAARDLARDLRARPTERLLRPEELAQRERARLEELEEARRARQAGAELDDEGDGLLEPRLDADLDEALEPPPPAEPLFDVGDEIPFTLAVPATYTQFAAALRGRTLEEKKLIIHRIRVTNHVHLRPENRLKMGSFYELLLRRFLLLAASPGADAGELDLLQVALYRLATEAPEQAVAVCKERLASLWAGRAAVWAGPAGPAYLRLLLNLFPATDFQHAVLTPALTFLGQRLATHAAGGPRGLLLSLAYATLLLQALRPSGRYSGELVGFLFAALAHLLGRPTSHPAFLALRPLAVAGSAPLLAFAELARPDSDSWYAEAGAGALRLTLGLLGEAVALYRAMPAFPEVFGPLAILVLPAGAAALEEQAGELRAAVAAGLAQHARRLPLRMQHQRPAQIPEYNPRFEEKTMIYKQDRDPDAARVEARRVKKASRDLRKGAGRELRKDAQFLAAQRLQEEKQRRATRDEKLKGIMGFLSNQNQGQGKAKRKR